ncbi:hypothetical protein LT679_16780 [Mucilaginibacter roseus]|uniref:Pentapeptide MXKDX repeat protein n=1 Tax=Mucilaginibacter roseus TaxID=1528868 RepID=A0ABS8U585_9SPHI|nr:hypothetical protein [Mucilaginibacter roseus]MCD8742266.1 hypothetical protein [Mucilaginibacter roseus]
MKKVITMVALAAISFGSVYAADVNVKSATMQQDSTKKMKKKMKKMKKDSTKAAQDTMKMR